MDDVKRGAAASLPWIMGCAVIGLLAALVYSHFAPKAWTSSAQVIVGGYAVPSDLGLQDTGTVFGPLGIEPPIEVQARLAAGMPVAEIAASDSRLQAEDSENFSDGVLVEPLGENVLTFQASGADADQARRRTDALVDAYATYRTERARAALATRSQALAKQAEAVKVAMATTERQLAGATGKRAEALTQQLTDLSRQAQEVQTEAIGVQAFADSFTGGMTVTHPAHSNSVVVSPERSRILVFGLIAGGLVGLAVGLMRMVSGPRTRRAQQRGHAGSAGERVLHSGPQRPAPTRSDFSPTSGPTNGPADSRARR